MTSNCASLRDNTEVSIRYPNSKDYIRYKIQCPKNNSNVFDKIIHGFKEIEIELHKTAVDSNFTVRLTKEQYKFDLTWLTFYTA